ncbi:10323_t:CDS:2, partial [Scutellospora calospora]
NSEQKSDENRKENKISSSNYDITKGVILGLAISFVTSYLNKDKISSLLDNVIKIIKNKSKEETKDVNNDDYFSEGGEGIVVEIDESKFSKRKYHRGRKVNSVWVIGGIEKTDESKIFLVIVEKRDKETIREIIEKHVEKGSIVHTDYWGGYSGIHELGVTQKTVNHLKNFINPESGVHTNSIE